MRPLSEQEKQILEKLLEKEFEGREILAEQLKDVLVDQIDENGSLKFLVKSPRRASLKYRVPVEAQCEDTDGTTIELLLHAVDGKVDELEIFRVDGSRVRRIPAPENLRTFAPPFKWR